MIDPAWAGRAPARVDLNLNRIVWNRAYARSTVIVDKELICSVGGIINLSYVLCTSLPNSLARGPPLLFFFLSYSSSAF